MIETAETTATVIARVPVDMKRELVARAREHDRSMSGEMRVLLRTGLRAERRPAALPEKDEV